jgi:replicative DNA helicase
MSDDETALRALASQAGVNSARLKTGMMDTADWIKITKAAGRLASLPVMVDDDGSQSVETLCAKARKWRRDPAVFSDPQHMGLVVVDYVQLIPTGKGKGQLNREQLVTEVFRQLKALAKELQVPVIALSQLNRSLEQRADKRPVNSDLRESGSIEQDADLIMFIYRDEVYHPESVAKGICEVIVRKNRQGSIGMVPMTFLGDYCVFEPFYGEMPREEQKQGRGMKWN